MTLDELIQGLPLSVARGDGATAITDVVDDSRQACHGCVFVARGGTQADGKQYIQDAIRRGAAAVITDRLSLGDESLYTASTSRPVAWVCGEPSDIDQRLVGRLADRFWGYPSKKLRLVGITGTNGKTTTAFLMQHLLNQAGCKCGMIGTVLVDDGDTRVTATLTTPGPAVIARHLAAMAANGCEAAVIEVSSHALEQGRTDAIAFDVGVFTNLTGDHLDYHGDMDTYATAKAKLFEMLPSTAWAVVNADDPYARRMVRDCPAQVTWCTVASDEVPQNVSEPTCAANILHLGIGHTRVRFDGRWGGVEANLPLVGQHNVCNALLAVAAASLVTDMSGCLQAALERCKGVPGRLERVSLPGIDRALPTVFVDYAHTHDALDRVLRTLKGLVTGRLIVVFGCGGDRDRTKRPKMAAAACRWAHRVYITSDNPRTEDPTKIIQDVLAGAPEGARDRVSVVADRAEAIRVAIAQAAPDDTVLIAGKGHEDYQIIGTRKHPFDDRLQAADTLRAWVDVRTQTVVTTQTSQQPGTAKAVLDQSSA